MDISLTIDAASGAVRSRIGVSRARPPDPSGATCPPADRWRTRATHLAGHGRCWPRRCSRRQTSRACVRLLSISARAVRRGLLAVLQPAEGWRPRMRPLARQLLADRCREPLRVRATSRTSRRRRSWRGGSTCSCRQAYALAQASAARRQDVGMVGGGPCSRSLRPAGRLLTYPPTRRSTPRSCGGR